VFDTFRGLPIHVLVVHAVVVGVPLMALVTAVVAFVRRWRERAAWLVVVADALLVGVVYTAKKSGEQLMDRIGTSDQIQRHADLGDRMLWFALALLLGAVLVALARKATAPLPTIAAVVALLTALAAVGWTVRTGEAGSDAVWQDIVANTTPGGG
jgi:hypothetical protein